MKIPRTPPSYQNILSNLKERAQVTRFAEILTQEDIGASPGGQYRHWENLRRVQPPHGLSSEEWWAAVKFARHQTRRTIPLKDKDGKAFAYSLADPVLELLHEIDRDANGRITTNDQITNPQTRERYIQSSLIEEAITSSQLEGASTTREAAKQMIRSGRNPMDQSERMILNNYRAIHLIRNFKYGRSFLYTETDDNDLTYFILAQLQVIRQAIDVLYAYLDKKASEIQALEQILRASVSLNHRQGALLGHALRHPGMRYTIAGHKKTHGVTYQTARTDLLDLVSRNLLAKTKTGRFFSFATPNDVAKRLQRLS